MDTIRYLFGDTVERHVSPIRYRLEKVAHTTVLAALAALAGVPFLWGALAAGLAYWLVGVAMVVKAHAPIRLDDKARDLALCLWPAAVAWSWLAALLCLAINAALVRVQD